MKSEDVVRRAYLATRLGVRYKIGRGGMHPLADTPADAAGFCDCSGFTCWALGFSRFGKDPFYLQVAGGWTNTDSMVQDAHDPRGFLDLVPPINSRPGDLYVFGKGPGRRYGHVGVVSAVVSGRVSRVIHCSPFNEERGVSAIAETGPSVFERYGAIVARYMRLIETAPVIDTRPVIRLKRIYATEFGGGEESGMPSAYGGKVDPDLPQASLPARVEGYQRWITVENVASGTRVRCRVNDVGPWNVADDYWNGNGRPAAEAQHRNRKLAQNRRVPTNPAGIDLTPAAMDALKVSGSVNTRSALVNWWFE